MENYAVILNLIKIVLIAILILIAIIDAKEMYINQKLLLVLGLGSIVSIFTNREVNMMSAMVAMVSIFLLLSFIYFVSRKSIGWGDVVLCSCIAPYLGVERAFTMIFVSMFFCGIVALVIRLANKANKNSEIPFAPFAAFGTILVLIL